MKFFTFYCNCKNSAFIRFIFLLTTVLFFSSCHKNEIVVDEPLLTKYNSIANPIAIVNASEDIDCYVDYSWGMGEGMKATAQFNAKLKDFLGGRKVSYYKVGASEIPPTIDINSAEANFLDPNNFKEPGSKLKIAIDKITSNKSKVSIFITDFERVEDVSLKQNLVGAPNPHPIEASAWAQNNFKDWLKEGNQIDIFAKQYQKPDFWFDNNHQKLYSNWIYTLVFTPNAVIKDENLFKTSVLKFLNDEYTNLNGGDSKHFTYTSNNFKIEQEKKDEAIGDANDNVVVQENITNTKENGFEFYYFKCSDMMSLNADETQKDKRVINKIKITSQVPCFSDIEYGLKVFDITQSLTNFSLSQNQEAPEVTSDAETGKKDTIANKPIIYNYEKGSPAENVFDFVYNVETNEIGIKLKPDFTGVTQNTIYQVDVIIKSAKLKDFSEENNVLKLGYAMNYSINSLSESVKRALADVSTSIENKVIYTIYIKIDK